jgi:sporulation protein YtfJ
MNEHQVNELLQMSLSSITNMLDVGLVAGKAIVIGDTTVIPIAQIKSGFLSGGVDYQKKEISSSPYGGVTGGTMNITPIAFLVSKNNEVKVYHLDEHSHILEKLVDLIPNVMSQATDLFQKPVEPAKKISETPKKSISTK